MEVVTAFCFAFFRSCIEALFQGRGVASSSGAAWIMNKTDSQTTLRMAQALSLSSNPTAGVKKASVCFQTKFQLVREEGNNRERQRVALSGRREIGEQGVYWFI